MIRTHASKDTAALWQRLRPLGHPAVLIFKILQETLFFCLIYFHKWTRVKKNDSSAFGNQASKGSATVTHFLRPLGPPAVLIFKILQEMLNLLPYLLPLMDQNKKLQ